VNFAHLLCFCMAVLEVGPVCDMLCCILCFSQVRRARGVVVMGRV
jgi:hypothetical protein